MTRKWFVALVLAASVALVSCSPSGDTKLDSRLLQAGKPFSYQVQPLVESDENVTYTATLADGSDLPAWLQFDPATLTFRGRAPTLDVDPKANDFDIRVVARSGWFSRTSSVHTLALRAPGAIPGIVNPAEELVEFAPDGILRWSAAAGADVYEVWAYRDAGLTQLAEFSKALVSRQYQFTQLAGGQTYHVKLYFRVGGVWSELPTFTIQTTSSVTKARLSNPQEELEGFGPSGTLRWSPVAGAEVYEVWVYRDASLVAFAEASGPLRITQYQITSLTPGRTYHVQVYARLNGSYTVGGPLALTVTAQLDKARILNSQEELDAFATDGILRWSPVTGATSYELWVFTNPNSSEIYENSGPLTGREYKVRTLQPGAIYYVQAYALVNGNWQVGAPMKVTTVATPTRPRLTNAQAELETFGTGGTLSWTEVPGATAYEAWIYGNAGLGVVAESGSASNRSYQVRRLCTGGVYYVQLHALVNGQWHAGWATRLDVTQGPSAADCVPPAPQVRLTASPLEVPSGGSVTLTWTTRFATSCEASGEWSGAKPLNGQETVGPITRNSLYTLACTGQSGTYPAQTLVTLASSGSVTVAGSVSDEAVSGALVEIRDPSGQVIGSTWTDGTGRFAVGVAGASLAGGYEVVATGGQSAGQPFAGELRAAYAASDNPSEANATLLTTLVAKLASREPSGDLIPRRNQVLDRLTTAGCLEREQWNSLAPENVALGVMRLDAGEMGLDPALSRIADMLSAERLADPLPETFRYFPALLGGVISLSSGRAAGGLDFDVLPGEILDLPSLQLSATSAAGDSPRYALLSGPDGMTIDPATGALEFVVPDAASGTAPFTIRVVTSAGQRDMPGNIRMLPVSELAADVATGNEQVIADDFGQFAVTLAGGNALAGTRISLRQAINSEGYFVLQVSADRPIPDGQSIQLKLPPPEEMLDFVSTTSARAKSRGGRLMKPLLSDADCAAGTAASRLWFQKWGWFAGTADPEGRIPVEAERVMELAPTLARTWLRTALVLQPVAALCGPVQGAAPVGEPVVFVHGYKNWGWFGLSARLGAEPTAEGNDTFGHFLEVLQDTPVDGRSLTPFLFRWNTNQRFQDAAMALDGALRMINAMTLRPAHVVAHSMGGVLVRTYLQRLRMPAGFKPQAVISVTSFGAPYSGLQSAASGRFPQGYDIAGGAICDQLSCYQLGVPLNVNRGVFNVLPGDLLASMHPASAQQAQFPAGVRYHALIGLQTLCKSFLDWTLGNFQTCEKQFAAGDGLITFQGQRFLAAAGTTQPLLRDAVVGGATVSEYLIGIDANIAGSIADTPVPLQYLGYAHAVNFFDAAIKRSIVGWPEADVRVGASPWCKQLGSLCQFDPRVQAVVRNIRGSVPALPGTAPPRIEFRLIVGGGASSSATVWVSSGGNQVPVRAQSLSNGELRFVVDFEPSRTYEFTLSAAGFMPRSGVFETGTSIGSTDTDLGTVSLPAKRVVGRATWNGTVRDATSRGAVAGAVWSVSCDGVRYAFGETGTNGVFSATGLPLTFCVLEAEAGGYERNSSYWYVYTPGTLTEDLFLTPGPPTTPGLWQGDFIDGVTGERFPTRAIVTDAGVARFAIFAGSDPRYSIGQVFGRVPTTLPYFRKGLAGVMYYDNAWSNGSLQSTVTLDGTVTPKVAWSGTYAEGPGYGTFDLRYQANFERASSLDRIAGTYSGTQIHDSAVDPVGYTTTLVVGTDGVLAGTDSRGCRYAGRVAVVNPARNYYSLAQVTLSNCPAQSRQVNGTYSGQLFFAAEGDGLTHLYYMANLNGGNAILTGYVARQAVQPAGVSIADSSGLESAGLMSFELTLDPLVNSPVSVRYRTVRGTAVEGSDFTSAMNTLTIPANTRTANIYVTLVNDLQPEGTESFTVELDSPSVNATIVDGVGLGTIVDDDGGGSTVNVGDGSGFELDSGSRAMGFPVSVSPPSAVPITLRYSTVSRQATSSDFQGIYEGTAIVPAGAPGTVINVPINGDLDLEPDETFALEVRSATANVRMADYRAIGTIWNDDVVPIVHAYAATDPMGGDVEFVTEGNANPGPMAYWIFDLVEPVMMPVVIHYWTELGTASSSDFQHVGEGLNLTVTIPAGQTQAVVGVRVNGDVLTEYDETFFLAYSIRAPASAAGMYTRYGRLVAVIRDDESRTGPGVGISIGDAEGYEGQVNLSTMAFPVQLSASSASQVKVSYAMWDVYSADVNSSCGSVLAEPGQLVFQPYETLKWIEAKVCGNRAPGRDAVFQVRLSSPVGAHLADPGANGLIRNDDLRSLFRINHADTLEGPRGSVSKLVFVVERFHPFPGEGEFPPVTVRLWTQGLGTALSDVDYVHTGGDVVFPAGETGMIFEVDVKGDDLFEGDETVVVEPISSPGWGAFMPDGNQAIGFIIDDDPPPP